MPAWGWQGALMSDSIEPPAPGPFLGPTTGSQPRLLTQHQSTVVMLYPGFSAQDEYGWLEQRLPGVRLPVEHTMHGPTDHEVDALLALGARERLVPAGTRARHLHSPDAVMWACTSGSFVYGAKGMHRQARWLADAAKVPASSTSIAFIEALRFLRVTTVAIAATYPPVVTGHFVHLLCEEGFKISACRSHHVESGEAAGELSSEAVWRMVGDRFPADVQAVLVPDTALHTLPLIEELENGLDKIVLTANQVTAWYGLRLAGWHGRVAGLGRLFL